MFCRIIDFIYLKCYIYIYRYIITCVLFTNIYASIQKYLNSENFSFRDNYLRFFISVRPISTRQAKASCRRSGWPKLLIDGTIVVRVTENDRQMAMSCRFVNIFRQRMLCQTCASGWGLRDQLALEQTTSAIQQQSHVKLDIWHNRQHHLSAIPLKFCN